MPKIGSSGLSFTTRSTVEVPWVGNFSRRSLLASLLLGLLAIYGKQYFVIGLGFVALQLFLARSNKLGVLYGLAAGLLIAASLLVVVKTSPYFLDATVILPRNGGAAYKSDTIFYEQFRFYLEI